jgi:hypothetical protein
MSEQPKSQIPLPQALQITEMVLNELQKFWSSSGHPNYRSCNLWHLGATKQLVVEHFYRVMKHSGNPEWCLPPADRMTAAVYNNDLQKLREEYKKQYPGRIPPDEFSEKYATR